MEYTRPLWALTVSQSDTENCTVCKICYQCFLLGKIQLIYTQKEIKLQQNKYMYLKYTIFSVGGTVAPRSSIRIFSDRELQTCNNEVKSYRKKKKTWYME